MGESKAAKTAKTAEPAKQNHQSNGVRLDDFPPELKEQAAAAVEAERLSLDKGIDAWKRVVAGAPSAWAPRRELARVYKTAERWKAYVEVLKEGVEKASWPTPEEKVPVLFEMVDVYRDRLKLDVMVVNAFNQILTIQPDNLQAVDALAAQYESMGRWPELISILRKKAAVVEAPDEKVALHLRAANLYLEKFSNQAEAIKAFEAALEIDPGNQQAVVFLKQMYEKRRDWDKLIALSRGEVGRIADPDERRRRKIDVARLASEKLKKPGVSIQLWREALAEKEDDEEALGELEKLYEREKQWGELAGVLEAQAAIAAPERQGPLLLKLAVLHTEKLQDLPRAVEAWKALIALEPDNRRAQDALRKLYIQQKDWDALEGFYAGQGKWDEYVRVLERQAETEDDATKVGLFNKIGQLNRDRLNKQDRAQKSFERALALDAANLAAAEALIPYYERSADAAQLAKVLAVQLQHTTSPDVRGERMQRLVALLDAEDGDKLQAVLVALQAFEEDPRADWAREAAERLAGETAAWGDLVKAYEAALPSADGPTALALVRTLARAYERELAEPERAIAYNKRLLELAPSDEAAVLALERLYIATEQFPELLAIYDKKLALAKSDAERREVRHQLAGLYEGEMNEPKKAIALHEENLEEAPDDLASLGALDRLYRNTKQWKQLVAVLKRELALTEDAQALAELKFRLGDVLEHQVGDKGKAVAAYREVLALDPSHQGARAALEGYLADPQHQLEAIAALEPIYEAGPDLDRLVEVQRIKLAVERDAAARVGLLLRIGGIEAARMQEDAAFASFAQAFREDPTSADARTALEDLAGSLDKWEALVALYGEVLAGSRKLEPTLERELLLVMAVAYDERLGRPEKAVEYFRQAQEILPEDASALEALERLYTRTERWPDLVETLRKKADLVGDAGEREQIHVRIATIWEEAIRNDDEAIAAWKEVLGANPTSLQALRALDRLFASKGLDTELADNLQRQLELTDDPDEMITLLGRLGHLRQDKIGDYPGAIETYRRLLELAPAHMEGVQALERMLSQEEHELALAEMLEPVYRTRGDFPRLIQVLEIEARHAQEPARRIALLQEIAQSYEDGADDPASAYETLGRALGESPTDEETQRRLERLSRALGRWDDLLGRYGHIVTQVPDPEVKGRLYHKVATLAQYELGDDARAVEAYESALAVNPGDLEAANALEQIFRRTEDWERLVRLLQRKIEMVPALAEKKDLAYTAAKIYEDVLDQPDKAIEVWNLVLAADDVDRDALDNLERLYVRQSRFSDLEQVYTRKAHLATSPEERKAALFVLGQVYDRELGNAERAIDTYSSILDIDPEDLEAVQALDRLYLQTERWADLLSVLERQTELSQSAGEIVSLRFRTGELWRHKLADHTRAAESYRQVLMIDPSHEPTLGALEEMMSGSDAPVLAAEVLEPIYETSGDWARVVAVYEVMVRHADDSLRKIELLTKVAELQERRLMNPEAAFDAYTRALRLDPSNPDVIAHLDRIAEVTVRWADLAAVYEAELGQILDSRLQVEMLLRVARIYEEETRELDKAIAAYKRVSDIEPDRREGLVALDRLYTQTQNWSELAEVLRRQVRLASTEEEIIGHSFRLAQILELALGDLPKAVEAYQDILNADPNHAETRAALERMLKSGTLRHEIAQILEPLYRLGEEWEKLMEVYQLELERLTDAEERQNLLRRLADIAEHRLFDQVGAFEWWGRAVLESPASEQGQEELLRLARSTHQWDAYVNTTLEAAEAAGADSKRGGAETRRDVLLRLASVFEIDLGDLQRAEEVLTQVLSEHPEDTAALAFLDRVYDRQGTFDALADVLRRRVALTDDGKELVALHLRLGRVLADVLDDPQGAIASYSAVLEHESRSPEALEALERLYFRREQWQELYGVYEKMVDIAPGDQVLADCYARMARLTSEVFEQREKAVDLWRKVLDLRGTDPVALAALADLHEQAEEWRELTEVLESQIRATEEPIDRIPTYKRLGRIWGEKLSRERNALECWQHVLEIDPGDVEALRAIAENYRAAGAWEELSETLGRLIGLGPETLGEEELKGLYTQLGELEGGTLMRTDRAIDAWRRVLEIDPADFRALAALEQLFTQEGRWEECVEVLERRAQALAAPEDQVDVLMQVASIWADKIGDGGAAVDAYERVLAVDPGNMTASVELEGLYKQRKSWMKLIELLLGRTDFVTDAKERIAILTQIADTYEKQLGDLESSFVTLQAAFREDYSNDFVARELERLARTAGKWNDLIAEYTQLVQTIPDTKQAADLWVKIARWYDSAVNRTDYAIEAANRALALEATHVDALSALEDFHRKLANWRGLVAVLARHAEVEQEPEKRVAILLALAETYENQIGDAAQAMLAYQQALDVDERCLEAIDALERLYRRTQAWDRLVDVLHKKSHTVDDPELSVKLRLQVGELWDQRLGDKDRAVEAYKEVLVVDPQNIEALRALERLYESTGKWDAYLDILEHELEVTPSDEDRITLYQRMADVWEEKFGKLDRAIDALQKVLIIDERNAQSYRDLERLYRAERRWDALAENYRQFILVTNDPDERTELYVRMGQVYEEELKDSERAIEAFSDVLSFEPNHVEGLRGLARLYEQTEQWERAEDVLRRLIPLAPDKEKVDLNYRLGKIFDEHMRMPETAEERLVEALSYDPAHVPSMLSLLSLYKRRGDTLKAAQLMVRAEAHTQNTLEKTRLLFEAGKLYQKELGEPERAAELYARTLELDPEHVEAAEPLSELYFKRNEWQPLVPLLEMLVRKTDRRANRELNLMYYRLAKACDQLGEQEKALRYYKQAYDLDSTHLQTVLDRAALLYKREQWDEAFKLYQSVLFHRDALKESEFVEVYHRAGQIKLKTGERAKAISMFEKVLEIMPGHRPTLETLVNIYTAGNDWETVIRHKRAMLAHAPTGEEKLALLEQIIEIYKTRLKNPQKAIAAYLEALEIDPQSHRLLHDVLDLFTETQQWKKAVEILMRLASLSTGTVKARYLETAGTITNHQLHSADDAIELFNQALDEDPDNLKTFERIDKILTMKRDWKNQERAYRRMIKRLGAEVPAEKRQTQVALWHALGEIYRSRLKDFRAAAQAFEVCVNLEPENTSRRVILAELYRIIGPDTYEKAIGEYRTLIKTTADITQIGGHLKTLHKLYLEQNQYDRAWCTTAALAFLRQVDADEQRFFEQYRPKTFARARARLTEELWQKNIYHPEEDRYVSQVLAMISQSVAFIRAREHKEWGIKRKDRVDTSSNQLLFSKVFNYVGQVLGTPLPELFLRPEWQAELDMANARDKDQLTPSFVVGAGLLQGRQERDLAYVVGKRLTLMRPEHFVRWPHVVPTVSELRVAFLAALKLVQPQVPVKQELQDAVAKYLELLRKTVPPQHLEQLAVVVQRFLASKAEADLHKWSNAVDYTATRAGFLMCGDLETAARIVQTEAVAVGSVEPKDKIKDLVQWSVSEEYFKLREHLGLTIA